MTQPTDKRTSRWWTGEDLLLLILLGVLFLLPGLGQIPLLDRDEPRFATAARTMQQTADYIVPRFNGNLRPDKPPLVYWLMNAVHQFTGAWNELTVRLPSALAGIGTLLVVYFMVGSRFGRLTGIIASIMLASCALFMFESRMSTADGSMLFFITLCIACAWQAWDAGAADPGPPGLAKRLPRADYLLDRSGDKSSLIIDHLPAATPRKMPLPLALVFWLSLSGGTLVKGVPLLFVLLPMIILSIATGALPGQLRRWRSHFHLTGARVGIALAIAALVTIFLITVSAMHILADARLWAGVLGFLLIGMVLTPGLPGVFARCLAGANWRWWRHLRPLLGIPLLILSTAWWVILAGRATDWKLIYDMVGTHFLLRSAGPLLAALHINLPNAGNLGANDPSKGAALPPGTYLALVWVTFWPWCILLVPTAYHTVRRLLGKTAIAIDPRPYQFLTAFIVPMWLCLELARGKLLHYPLPLYVPLAILCADTLVQSWYRLTDVLAASWFGAMRWVTLAIWLGMGTALLIAAKMNLEPEWFARCIPFAAALLATGLVSAFTWGRPSWPFALVLTWGGALLIANTLLLPELPLLQVSRLTGRKMADLKKADPALHLAARGYDQATLVFYAGSNIEIFPTLAALLEKVPFDPTHPPAPADRYVIAVDDATRAQLDEKQIPYSTFYTLPRVTGLNLGNYKPTAVTLITNVPHELPTTTQSQPASAPASSKSSLE